MNRLSTYTGSPASLILRVAAQRLLEQDPQLQPRQRGPQTEVPSTGPERLVLGVAPQVEAIRILIAGAIPVGGHVPHHDLVPLP